MEYNLIPLRKEQSYQNRQIKILIYLFYYYLTLPNLIKWCFRILGRQFVAFKISFIFVTNFRLIIFIAVMKTMLFLYLMQFDTIKFFSEIFNSLIPVFWLLKNISLLKNTNTKLKHNTKRISQMSTNYRNVHQINDRKPSQVNPLRIVEVRQTHLTQFQ